MGDLDAESKAAFVKSFRNPDSDAVFSFCDLTFDVDDSKSSDGVKTILHGISAAVRAGEVLGILGPSGSGKTTLLNMLTLVKTSGRGSGSITLNGRSLGRSNFVRNCFYVPQEGAHHAYLTPRETLTYAARLFSNGNSNGSEEAEGELSVRVNTLLKIMGLVSCADVKVGNAFFQGLSGGQKKRLSVAVALLSSPLVLFLDEPTSGLDSAAALGIMEFLHELASLANIMIVCTIHQPSAQVFMNFSQVLLLANGHTAYLGEPAQSAPYFKSIGSEMPIDANPAEFMLDLVNDEFTSGDQVRSIISSFASSGGKSIRVEKPKDHDLSRNSSKRVVAEDTSSSTPSFWSQFIGLTGRHGLMLMRDPLLYALRSAVFLLMGLFFSIVYINMRTREQEQVLNRMWVTLWYVGPPSSLSVIAVFYYNSEFKTIKNELKNGMVRPLAYVLSNLVLQAPLMYIMTFIGFVIPMYGISNLQPDNLPIMIGMLAATFWVFECYAQMSAIQFDNFLIGMLGVLNLWFMCFIFSGLMIQINDVPWPFRAFMYALPLKYSLASLSYIEFHGTSFSGAYYNGTGGNFTCPGLPVQECYGVTGDDCLNTLHNNWGTITDENNVGRDFGILIGSALIFKLGFAFLVYMKGTESQAPSPPKQKKKEGKDEQAVLVDVKSTKVDEGSARAKRQAAFVNEFANTNMNATFEFKNMFYEVDDSKNKDNKEKKKVKQIIKGVEGSVRAGEMLVIMGPSGAGKTTLLNMLTLEKVVGSSYGSVLLNGSPLTRDSFTRNCFYVPQYGTHYAFLTPRETLRYAGKLFSADHDKVEKRVEALIEIMGLTSCADTIIGNEFLLGLSGGQKKRLSIAVALLSRPLVLFLDEPTTGLDAAAAAGIMKVLKDLASSAHILVVCTIHQPSSQVFQGFDNIMLLSRGETVFLGNATDVVPYFARIGFPMPQNTTASEYMLDLVNDEFTEPRKVRAVVRAWSESPHAQALKDDIINRRKQLQSSSSSSSSSPPALSSSSSGASFFQQIALLLQRHGVLVLRDPTQYSGRMIAILCSNLFFCIIYLSSRDRQQDHVISRMFNLMWCVGTPSSMALIVVYAQNREMFSIMNEVKNGMIRPIPYLISNFLLQLPFMFLLVIVGYLIPFYGVIDANPSHIGETIVILAAILWSFESVAQAQAVLDDNFLLGMLNFMNLWFSSFLFAGVVIRESDVPWPFKLFLYISPLRYGLETVVYLDTIDNSYSGASACTATSPYCSSGLSTCSFTDNNPNCFTCPGLTSSACFGNAGNQVLDSLHVNFDTMTSQNRTAMNIGVCIAIAVGFKLVFWILLYMKVIQVQVPSSAGSKVPIGTAAALGRDDPPLDNHDQQHRADRNRELAKDADAVEVAGLLSVEMATSSPSPDAPSDREKNDHEMKENANDTRTNEKQRVSVSVHFHT